MLIEKLRFSLATVALAFMLGCRESTESPGPDFKNSVVIYCSVDVAFAEPILDEFQRRTGITVHHIFDTEAGKTTGLVNRLSAEKARPRADVWWSSEIFGTIQLAERGILAPYKSPVASDIPDAYRDPAGHWTAIGLRGRVIAYDPKRTKEEDLPKRWCDLTNPKYKGRFQIADPRFGTTRGHMAVLLSRWGQPAMEGFYEALRANDCQLADGNAKAVLNLTRGLTEFVATDTDDVIVAQARGDSVEMIYPDLDAPGDGPTRKGTLWIPCSVGLVAGGPNTEAGKQLFDYLISKEVEALLFESESRNVPVRPALRKKLRARATNEAVVDYAEAAEMLPLSDQLVREKLLE